MTRMCSAFGCVRPANPLRHAEGLCDKHLRTTEPDHPPTAEQRFSRPDGSLDVLAYCRHLDAIANRGAGPMRREGEDRG